MVANSKKIIGNSAQNKYTLKHYKHCAYAQNASHPQGNFNNSALSAAENLEIAGRPITAARFRYAFGPEHVVVRYFAVGRAPTAEMIQSIPSGSPSKGRKCVRFAQTLSREARSSSRRRRPQQYGCYAM
jgi:hypothetical protein